LKEKGDNESPLNVNKRRGEIESSQEMKMQSNHLHLVTGEKGKRMRKKGREWQGKIE